jgi:hypothetical protein
MNSLIVREQLRQQIDRLPDDLLQEIADFIAFVLMRRRHVATYTDWEQNQWDTLTAEQFFRETDDEVEYSLKDAQAIFHLSLQDDNQVATGHSLFTTYNSRFTIPPLY